MLRTASLCLSSKRPSIIRCGISRRSYRMFSAKSITWTSRSITVVHPPSSLLTLPPRVPVLYVGNDMMEQRHYYSTLSKEEEEKEKARVASLTAYQKEMELRELDTKIARLNTLRGINTGELYTIRGKFKMLARDYGIPFMVWYWTVWTTTCILTYGAIEIGNVDVMALLANVDDFTGFDLSTKVDPTLGTIGLTVVVNEMLEPLRLPFVVLTTKPVVNFFSPSTRHL